MPAFDNDQMFRTTGSLTTKETKGPLTIRGGPVSGLAIRVSVPSNASTTKTLAMAAYVSDDNSTYVLGQTYEGGTKTLAAGVSGDYIIPLVTAKKYVKLELAPGGGTGGLGTVVAGLVEGVGFDWSRSVDWT